VKYFDDETTINQNIKREMKEGIEQQKSGSKEKNKRQKKRHSENAGCHVMNSRLVPYICYLINYILL
jgi:hypothetical protein